MGYDENGRQRRKTTTYRPPDGVTPKKAEKLARQYAAVWEEQIRGYVSLDENRTFAELAEWYYTAVAPLTLKPNVLSVYRQGIGDHIMPALGKRRLGSITPAMLDSLFAELKRSGNLKHRYRLRKPSLCDGFTRDALSKKSGIDRVTLYTALRGDTVSRKTAEKLSAALGLPLESAFDDVTEKHGLSGATTNALRANLSAIFSAAVKKEIMRRNPCKLMTPLKNDTPPAAYLDEGQCRRLLELLAAQEDFQFEVIVNLMIASGIRAGELSALYWEDISLDTNTMFIRCTLVRVNGQYLRQEPKTKSSARRILLPESVVRLLRRHKLLQGQRRLAVGAAWKNAELVFTNQSGGFYLGANMNAKLKRVLRGTDLPQQLHLHSLRHTYASLLINSDISARVVADRLGHATTQTTLNVYSHVFAESETRAMQAIDLALFSSGE